MNVKHFSIAPSSLGTLSLAIRMQQLGTKYYNGEQFAKICEAIGREFVCDIARPDKAEKILKAAAANAAAAAVDSFELKEESNKRKED